MKVDYGGLLVAGDSKSGATMGSPVLSISQEQLTM